MRLRARLQDALRTRIATHLPEATGTVWDHDAVVIAIEKLEFKPAGGVDQEWQLLASFSGTVRAELRADGIDALAIEPLLTDLICHPLFLPEADVAVGDLTETARCDLRELRDSLTDMQVVAALRLSVTGLIVQRAVAVPRPDAVMLGAAPDIGRGHEGDYRQIGGDL